MNQVRTAVLILLFGGVGLAGCTSSNPKEASRALGHTIRLSHRDDIKSVDPAVAYDVYSWEVLPLIHETLYHFAYLDQNMTPVPLVAGDFPRIAREPKSAGQIVRIPIRQDITFQDDPAFAANPALQNRHTRVLEARDFIYAWDRLKNPKLNSPGGWIFDARVAGYSAPDAHTIEIRLNEPYPQLLQVLSLPFSAPVPEEIVKAYATPEGLLVDHAIGTGPFVLKRWIRNQRVELERNPHYATHFYPTPNKDSEPELKQVGLWADAGKPLPFLDHVTFEVTHEQEPAWLKFTKGELDALTLTRESFSRAVTQGSNIAPELAAQGIRLHEGDGLLFYYLSFNFNDPVVGGNSARAKLLRHAISLAIDRDRWIEVFAAGRGQKQVAVLPPGVPGRPEKSVIQYDYNPKRAKELLKQAGFPEGKGLPMLNLDLRGADSLNRQMGEFFSQSLAEVGIKVNAILNAFPQYLEKSKLGRTQIMYDGWQMDFPDAENVYQLLYSGNKAPGPNVTQFDNPKFDSLYRNMRRLPPGPERTKIIAEMDRIIQDEGVWALGFYQRDFRVSQPWVHNFRAGEMFLDRVRYLRVDPDERARYWESR